jgi:hypothetical protein
MYRRGYDLRRTRADRRRAVGVVMVMKRGSGKMGVASSGSGRVVRCEELWASYRLHRALLSIHSFCQYIVCVYKGCNLAA